MPSQPPAFHWVLSLCLGVLFTRHVLFINKHVKFSEGRQKGNVKERTKAAIYDTLPYSGWYNNYGNKNNNAVTGKIRAGKVSDARLWAETPCIHCLI